MSDLRYPVGQFQWTQPASEEQSAKDRARYIDVLSKLPAQMRAAVQGLAPEQLETPYRPEGWTVRQVVHHVPDSHMNAYVRFKLALTEEQPPIKPYDRGGLGQSSRQQTSRRSITATTGGAALALGRPAAARCQRPILDAHCTILNSGVVTLDRMLALYAWHSAHHLAHITTLRERMGWKQRAAAAQQ